MQKYYDMPLSGKVMTVFIIFLILFCAVSQDVLQVCLAVFDDGVFTEKKSGNSMLLPDGKCDTGHDQCH